MFTATQQRRRISLYALIQQFSDKEAARLMFLRWLVQTGRLQGDN